MKNAHVLSRFKNKKTDFPTMVRNCFQPLNEIIKTPIIWSYNLLVSVSCLFVGSNICFLSISLSVPLSKSISISICISLDIRRERKRAIKYSDFIHGLTIKYIARQEKYYFFPVYHYLQAILNQRLIFSTNIYYIFTINISFLMNI